MMCSSDFYEGKALYKVLRNGVSFHGGTYDAWSLPRYREDIQAFVPGKWTPDIPNVKVCERGWHLTTHPQYWLDIGCKVYRAEGRGEMDGNANKIAFTSVRLVEDVPEEVPLWLTKIAQGLDRFGQWNLGETTRNRVPPEQQSFIVNAQLKDVRQLYSFRNIPLPTNDEAPLFVTVTAPSMSAAIDKARREYFLSGYDPDWVANYAPKVLYDHPSGQQIEHSIDKAIYTRLRRWSGAAIRHSEELLEAIIVINAVGVENDSAYHQELERRVNRYIEVLDKGWLPVGRLPNGTIVAVGVDHDEA